MLFLVTPFQLEGKRKILVLAERYGFSVNIHLKPVAPPLKKKRGPSQDESKQAEPMPNGTSSANIVAIPAAAPKMTRKKSSETVVQNAELQPNEMQSSLSVDNNIPTTRPKLTRAKSSEGGKVCRQ